MTTSSHDIASRRDAASPEAGVVRLDAFAAAVEGFEQAMLVEVAGEEIEPAAIAPAVGAAEAAAIAETVAAHHRAREIPVAPRAAVHPHPGGGGRRLVVVPCVEEGEPFAYVAGVIDRTPTHEELSRLAETGKRETAKLRLIVAQRRERRIATEANALLETTRALAASAQLPKLVPAIARALAAGVGFERATVLLLSRRGSLIAGASHRSDGQPDLRFWGVFRGVGAGLPAVREVLASRRALMVEQPATEAALEPDRWVVPFGIESVLIVPLVDRGDVVGFAVLDDRAPQRVTSRRLEAAMRIAEQGATSVGIAQMVRDERAARQRAQLVLGTVVQAATQMSIGGVLGVIAEGINAVIDDTTTTAFVMQGRRPGRLAVAGRGLHAVDVVDAMADAGFWSGTAGSGPGGGLVQCYPDDATLSELTRLDVGRALVVPIRRAGRDLGWVVSFDRTPQPYHDDDLRVVSGIAAQAALSLHTASLLEGERAAVARLEELDRLKTAFVAAVSHELRTPLTAIVGFSEILAEEIDDRDLRGFLDDMRREAAVLEALIGNLLDTSRLEAGMLRLNLAWTGVDEVLDEAIEVVRHAHRDRAVSIEVAATVPRLLIDSGRLRQVFVNLLENAAKYSPPGSPVEVTVDGPHEGLGADEVWFQVEDHGPGIPVEHRDAVFQRFHRLADDHAKPGTGIGLYLVRALVEAHGGRISVHGRRDGRPGARFVVALPLTRADDATDRPAG